MNKPRVHWSKTLIVSLAISVLLIVADLVIKWVVELNCVEGLRYEVIPNFFYITKSYNTAIAFSIGSNLGVAGRIINILISLVMSVLIYFFWLTHDHKITKWERVVGVLLGAGAVGNLIDRAFYWQGITGFDGVIDMFQFYLGGGPSAPMGFFNPFATFNFADACLVVGIALLLVITIVDMIKKPDPLKNDPRLEKPQPIQTAEEKPEDTPKEGE